MSGDARDFNNIETRALIKFSFLQSKASKEIPANLTETLGEMHRRMLSSKSGWPSLNIVIFQPVKRFVLYDPKQ